GRVVAARELRVAELRRGVQQLSELQGNEKAALQKLAGIQREAGQASLKAVELVRRFGLTNEVPCVGTDMQGQCKLLGDAIEAKVLMPSADLQVTRLAEQQAVVHGELAALRATMATLAD